MIWINHSSSSSSRGIFKSVSDVSFSLQPVPTFHRSLCVGRKTLSPEILQDCVCKLDKYSWVVKFDAKSLEMVYLSTLTYRGRCSCSSEATRIIRTILVWKKSIILRTAKGHFESCSSEFENIFKKLY